MELRTSGESARPASKDDVKLFRTFSLGLDACGRRGLHDTCTSTKRSLLHSEDVSTLFQAHTQQDLSEIGVPPRT